MNRSLSGTNIITDDMRDKAVYEKCMNLEYYLKPKHMQVFASIFYTFNELKANGMHSLMHVFT